jgi:hypothetical protein
MPTPVSSHDAVNFTISVGAVSRARALNREMVDESSCMLGIIAK